MSRTLLAISAILVASLTVTPAAQDMEQFKEDVDRIVAEALQRGATHDRLRRLCQAAPGRLAGSPAAAAAVEWARQEMEALGLQNVRLESCDAPHWVRGDVERLAIAAPGDLAGRELPIHALGGSVATPEGGLTGAVVRVTSFDELTALGEEARGKIVLFDRPMDDRQLDTFKAYGGAVDQRVRGAIEAARAGAIAAIVRSITTLRDDVPHTGGMRYESGVEQVPSAAISTLGADLIAARLTAGDQVVLHLELSCGMLPEVPSSNVVGELIGTELPDEILVVGGHLDCWDVGEGAHDDGAGCCQSLEVARILLALDLRPRRTIRVVLFMNEENGARGARAYVADHAVELEQHVIAMESDRGGFAPRGFTCDARDPAARAIVQSIATLLAPIGASKIVEGGGGVDVGFMAPAGVVTMGYLPDSQRYFDYHHAATDVFAAVNRRELELGSAAMTAMLHVLANLDERIPSNTR